MAEEADKNEKTFYIRSKLNGLVLDIKGAKTKPGTQVVTWHLKSEENDNQLWYEDESTGTIRTKLNDFCLDLGADGELVINHYIPGNLNQQWKKGAHRIQNTKDEAKFLEIGGADSSPGAKVQAAVWNGGDNQKWDFPRRHEGAKSGWRAKRSAEKPFYIRSTMHGKVLDVKEGNKEPGAEVVVWAKNAKPSDNQLWYTDEKGIIRSKLNDFALTSSKGGFTLQPFDESNQKQQWTYQGNKIFNKENTKRCLDISEASTEDGAKVIPFEYKGDANQQWHFDFI